MKIILTVLVTSCVNLAKSFDFYESQFPHPWNKVMTYILGKNMRGFNKVITIIIIYIYNNIYYNCYICIWHMLGVKQMIIPTCGRIETQSWEQRKIWTLHLNGNTCWWLPMQVELGWVRDKTEDLDLGIRMVIVLCVNIDLWNVPGTFTCVCQRRGNGSALSGRRMESPANY